MNDSKLCSMCRATVLIYAVEINELCFLCKEVLDHGYKSHTVSDSDVACGVDYINEVRHHIASGDLLTATIILDLLQDIVTGERHCDAE